MAKQAEQLTDEDIVAAEAREIDAGIEEIPEIESATPSGAAVSDKPKPSAGEEEEVEEEETVTPEVTPKPSTAATSTPVVEQPVDDEVDEETAKILAMEPKTRAQREGFGPIKDHLKKLSVELRGLKKTLADKDKEIETIKQGAPPEEKVKEWQALEERANKLDVEHMIRSRYAPKREQILTDATDALKQFGIKESVIKVINDRGGLVKFSTSKRLAGPQWKNDDGKPMTEADWFDAHVFSKLTRPQQAQVIDYQKDFQKIEGAERREIEEGTKNAREFIDKQQSEFRERFNKEVNGTLKELIESLPAEVPRGIREVPKDATPETKKEIEFWNDIWKKGDQVFTTKVASVLSARDRTELSFKAAVYDAVMQLYSNAKEQAASEKARADKAEEQLTNIRKSRNMGRLNNAPPKPAKEPDKPDHEMSDEEAVDRGL